MTQTVRRSLRLQDWRSSFPVAGGVGGGSGGARERAGSCKPSSCCRGRQQAAGRRILRRRRRECATGLAVDGNALVGVGRFGLALAVQRFRMRVGDRRQSRRQRLEDENEPGDLPEPFASVTAVQSHVRPSLPHPIGCRSPEAGGGTPPWCSPLPPRHPLRNRLRRPWPVR